MCRQPSRDLAVARPGRDWAAASQRGREAGRDLGCGLAVRSLGLQALRQENQELRDWVTTLKRLVEGRVKVVEDGVRQYSSRLKIGYGFDSQETEDPQGTMQIKGQPLKTRIGSFFALMKLLMEAEIRERDWYNVVTCHMDTPQAYVWHLQNFVNDEHILLPLADI
ncbi:hypothetical protein ZIOFF_000484 [Zingiber officinale]|uniref:Uncharacterized protein n=1 Tax=Zingiber officinale TaxID=94328 RepID=A0A8J5LRG3_ZINOF|nr:hypothetical protein ZIOFF_000484 [Zingiber officinale]